MDVIKRSGEVQRYDPHKITGAMRKAFESVNQDCNEEQLSAMLAQVERAMGTRPRTVEAIQDEVERAYSKPAIDFKMLDIFSACMISVDVRYERKMAASYSVKANPYQEYCLEIVGGVETTPMASWRVYRRYSELRCV